MSLQNFPWLLALYVVLLAVAASAAVWAVVGGRFRRQVLARMEGPGGVTVSAPILITERRSLSDRFAEWIRPRLPQSWTDSTSWAEKLLQAGFESRGSVAIFSAIRLVFGLVLPVSVFVLVAGRPIRDVMMFVVVAIAIGILGPSAAIDRMIQMRRDRLRRAIPDMLDLMVVCVEAGVSLDAAILRVSRDLGSAHPEMAEEMAIINRKVNAGVPREQALQGLWTRTGIEELRSLAANMVQSERWGTSIAKVLRINAETLRRKRKQTAEKKAAQAALKMMAPLLLFLLPALFVVILGPAVMRISTAFATQ
jgi:tight adherence protein C